MLAVIVATPFFVAVIRPPLPTAAISELVVDHVTPVGVDPSLSITFACSEVPETMVVLAIWMDSVAGGAVPPDPPQPDNANTMIAIVVVVCRIGGFLPGERLVVLSWR
jgi:hypothetical protein